jgi:hypothetical protein
MAEPALTEFEAGFLRGLLARRREVEDLTRRLDADQEVLLGAIRGRLGLTARFGIDPLQMVVVVHDEETHADADPEGHDA